MTDVTVLIEFDGDDRGTSETESRTLSCIRLLEKDESSHYRDVLFTINFPPGRELQDAIFYQIGPILPSLQKELAMAEPLQRTIEPISLEEADAIREAEAEQLIPYSADYDGRMVPDSNIRQRLLGATAQSGKTLLSIIEGGLKDS